jgi:hypothetical protein
MPTSKTSGNNLNRSQNSKVKIGNRRLSMCWRKGGKEPENEGGGLAVIFPPQRVVHAKKRSTFWYS